MNTLVLIALLVVGLTLCAIAFAILSINQSIGRVADAIEKDRAKISDQPTVDLLPHEMPQPPADKKEHVEPLEARKPRPIRL